jgi:hypothetical protein
MRRHTSSFLSASIVGIGRRSAAAVRGEIFDTLAKLRNIFRCLDDDAGASWVPTCSRLATGCRTMRRMAAIAHHASVQGIIP